MAEAQGDQNRTEEENSDEDQFDKDISPPVLDAIKVTKLPDQVEEDLENFFSSAMRTGGGPVKDVELHEYDNSAIVTFEDPSVVDRVLKKQPLLFKKKAINVEIYEKPVPRTDDSVGDCKEIDANSNCTIEVRNYREDTDEETFMDYFENERKSGGGPNTVVLDAKHERVLVTFEWIETTERVLKTKSHKLHGAELKVSLFIPPKPRDTYRNKVLVQNIKKETDDEGLLNFVEAKFGQDVKDVDRVTENKAILTFEESIDIDDFQKKIAKRKLKGNTLSAEKVPIANSITVRCSTEKMEEETIELYFENARKSGGGAVENVRFKPDTKEYIVSFEDYTVLDNICKRQHTLKGEKLSVGVFYDFLETNKENVAPTAYPRPVEIPVGDPLIYKYLTTSPFAEEVSDLFTKHHAKITLPESKSKNFFIECTIPRNDESLKQISLTWRKEIEDCFEGLIKEINKKTYRPLKDALNGILNGIKSLVSKHEFIIDVESDSFSVVGKRDEVSEVFDKIDKISEDVEKELQRKTKSMKETISSLKYGHLLLLKASGYESKVSNAVDGLQVEIDLASKTISFQGFVSDVQAAKVEMYEICHKVNEVKIDHFSNLKLDFLSTPSVQAYLEKKKEEAHFKDTCVWNREGTTIDVSALCDEDLVQMSTILKSSIVDHLVGLKAEALPLLQTVDWENKYKEINDSFTGLVQMYTTNKGIQILTTKENAGSIIELVDDFFKFNTMYEKSVSMERGVLRYLNQEHRVNLQTSLKDENVALKFAKDHIKITGTSAGIQSAEHKIQVTTERILSRYHTVDKPGVGKYLMTQGKDKLSTIEKNQHCVIETGKAKSGRDLRKQSKDDIKVIASCNTKQGCKLKVLSGDLTELKVDAIINAANTNLDHCGGIAQAIVKKGGKLIQEECSTHIKNNGSLLNGDVFESSAGNLQCKAVIHAVGPMWSDGYSGESDYLAAAVDNSLDLCVKQSYRSVAIPAISTGIFHYPLQEAAKVIIETVKEFLEERPDGVVEEIIFCDIKHDTVQAFVQQLKKIFGNSERIELAEREETRSRTARPEQGMQPIGSSKMTSSSKIKITVERGQIMQQKTAVIVNTTSRDLCLSNGAVSASILNAAGQELQDMCNEKYPQGVEYGDIAITTGAQLNCLIFHGALESWKTDGQTLKTMESFIDKCLATADMEGMESIAFPALGTGGLNYPKDIVAKVMFDKVLSFSSTSVGALKEVVFVIYDKDKETYQAFQIEEEKRRGPKDISTRTKRQYGRTEITAGAVASALTRKGGKSLSDAIKGQRNEMSRRGISITTSGADSEFPFHYIIHLATEELNNRNIKAHILKCLNMADENDCSSLALPALGTGNLGVQVENLAQCIFEAILEFQTKANLLTEVYIIMHETKMIDPFLEKLKECATQSQAQQSTGTWKKWFGFGGSKGEQVPIEFKEPQQENISLTLTLYAENESCITRAIQAIDRMCESDFNQQVIKDDAIKHLSESQIELIQNLKHSHFVEAKLEKKLGRIRLKGLPDNLTRATALVYRLVREASERLQHEETATIFSDMVSWCVLEVTSKGQDLVPYPATLNMQIEKDFRQNKQQTTFVADGKTFVLDFQNMEEYPSEDIDDKVKVIRKDKISGESIKLPDIWDKMNADENVSKITLQQNSPEYNDVLQTFNATLGGSTVNAILKIERIQNKLLYQQYEAKKKFLETQNQKGHNNEMILWHGTATGVEDSINTYGFNRSYCGKNGTAYGNGVYFAVNSSYSTGYAKADSAGNRRMYRCRVLTGEYTKGKSDLIAPPVKSGHILYDSVVDRDPNMNMFVVFNDTQAYPDYLITFK